MLFMQFSSECNSERMIEVRPYLVAEVVTKRPRGCFIVTPCRVCLRRKWHTLSLLVTLTYVNQFT